MDRKNGLDWMDYGARHFAGHGQWTSPDPLAENYYDVSPYVYCVGNPIKFVDSDGEDVWIFYKDNKGREDIFHFNGAENITHSNPFVNDFLESYYYLNQHGAGKNISELVKNSKYKVFVYHTEGISSTESYRGIAHIWWDSRAGIQTTDGGLQSPALQLEHEFDHARSRLIDLPSNLDRSKQYDAQYDNAEEKRVITGSEKDSAIRLGEGVRNNHKGKLYKTTRSTSTQRQKKRITQHNK